MSQTKLLSGSLPFVLLACTVLSSISGTAFAFDYSMVDLGSLGGTSACATGINNAGQIVGYSTGSDGQQHPFSWNATNGMQIMPTDSHFVPLDINDNGVVAGYVDTYAAFWSSSLGLNALGEAGGVATSVNNNGLITGWAGRNVDPYMQKTYVWSLDGSATDLGFSPYSGSLAFGINSGGQVVGTANGEAFVWDADNGAHYLGALGPDGSSANAISDTGMVVGLSDLDWHTKAVFTWTKGSGMSLAFTFNSEECYTPVAVDSSGMIVGNCSSGVFTWSANDGLAIVGQGEVCGINDSGQFVGRIRTSTGYDAVLWQPVPEPSSLLALLAGFVTVGGLIRRQTR